MKKTCFVIFVIVFSFIRAEAQWGELGGTLSIRLGDSSPASTAYAVAMDDSQNVFVCGEFQNAAKEYIVAQYNKKSKTWSELGGIAGGGLPLKANASVTNVIADHEGNVYANGNFTNSLGKRYLAKWTKKTNSWSAVGSIIPGWTILKDKSNNIYVAVSDTTPSGRVYDYIAKWDGTKWSTFGPPAFDTTYPYRMDRPITGMVMSESGKIYVYKCSVVMVNDGTRWSDTTYFPTYIADFVFAMALDPDGNLYLGDGITDLTNSVYKLDAKTKVLKELCTKTPAFPTFRWCSVNAIAAVSSAEIYVAGSYLLDTGSYLQVVKWSKATDEWSIVGTDSEIITGNVNSLLIDTIGKASTILIAGYLSNAALSLPDVEQFVGEFTQYCNAYFTILPTGAAHTYTLTNYAYGKGKLKYKWNWGDGSALDTGATPSHVYASAGIYQICVEIRDSLGCSSSFCTPANSYLAKTSADMVYVNVVKGKPATIVENNSDTNEFSIYPNPASETVVAAGKTRDIKSIITITDLTGKILLQKDAEVLNGSFKQIISLSSLESGMYFIQLKTNNGISTQKLFKN